ncbi:Fe-S-cluster containining protein [Geothermobacter ehrlichii]|uniref:Fe-S-cluster containining protein n=1 Tax=Geothermobacter ehrlichii TaxID=213224 RepID=A0A5D3WH86_9BACT|nr:YkgJ family cysteine cluster protein [Geothermobacter ehrlichii]TYO98219.1 Fe-S-cluster containining protein [Geothermobacter ehrlichii]
MPSSALAAYRQLLTRIDAFAAKTRQRLGEQLYCRPGCAGCCTHIGVLPVEALALSGALAEAPPPLRERVRKRLANTAGDDCPLLEQNLCLLYDARPVICRTQGLPLLVGSGEERRIDFCPLNFRGLDSLPGEVVLDLDRLNQTLVAINLLLGEKLKREGIRMPERLRVAEALVWNPLAAAG